MLLWIPVNTILEIIVLYPFIHLVLVCMQYLDIFL